MFKEFINKKQIIDVDLTLLKKMSCDLAKQVQKSGYAPEHILYVERAGLLVGFEMAAFFQCKISGIHSKRSGGSAKSKLKVILRRLPRFATHFLRQLELGSNIHEIKKERHVSCENAMPPKEKKILIVDDAIDTGHSLISILDYLKQYGYSSKNIKIAVLTTTGAAPALRADFSLLDQVVCAFPWSYDSRQYDETQGVYNTEKYVLTHFRILPVNNLAAFNSEPEVLNASSM